MMNQKIPEYYLTKDNITFYLVFVFFFSLLFVNIFTPFHGAGKCSFIARPSLRTAEKQKPAGAARGSGKQNNQN